MEVCAILGVQTYSVDQSAKLFGGREIGEGGLQAQRHLFVKYSVEYSKSVAVVAKRMSSSWG